MNFKKVKIMAAIALVLSLVSFGNRPAFATDATVIVRPTAMHGWGFFEEVPTGSGALVNGPATPPLGSGSANLIVDSTGRELFGSANHVGTRLDAITSLAYSTYQTGSSSVFAVSLQFDMDYDLTDLNTAWQGRLVYEPYQNGTVIPGTWQTWDPFTTGIWWASGAPGNGPCPQSNPCLLSEVLLAFPDAGLSAGVGIAQFKAGGPWGGGFNGNVDAFTIGVNGNNTTYDFELATTVCTFTTVENTMTLDDDCTTYTTILVPQGFTLDGAGNTITAEDPSGGHFLGAVIMNDGTEANVENLTVIASGLSDVCDEGANRLRGILFDGAGGLITNNTVTNINQGASGCQEGNGIEARNEPFDNTGPDVTVTISGNTVTNYQKNGITANGSVAATILNNTVAGAGPVNWIAQNGIQVGFGGTAILRDNSSSGNDYTPPEWVACGLLYYQADGVSASHNNLFNNERNICNFGKGGGQYNPNP